MALSYVFHAGDGATTNFTFDKGYVVSTNITVYLEGVLQSLTTDYTWFNVTTISFNSAPALDDVILFDRNTDKENRVVDFQDAANLTEADLDLSALQLFYIAQEAYDDFSDSSLSVGVTNKWDFENRRGFNILDGVDDQDLVSKLQVETLYAAAQVAMDAIYDQFDDRYLGSKSAAPTVDNDSNTLLEGALYWNTVLKGMYVYSGTAWIGVTSESGALLKIGGTMTGAIQMAVNDEGNSGTSLNIDWGLSNKCHVTLTGNVTFTMTDPADTANYVLLLTQDATGTRTVTWPADVRWAAGVAPVLSVAANAVDIISFYRSENYYYGAAGLNYS